MDVTILHHNLKELIITSDKSEKLDDGIVERVAIASLCANLRKLTLRNMKNLKTLDIFSAEVQTQSKIYPNPRKPQGFKN